MINPTGGVTLQAAPGVEATLDAVLQGDPAGNNNARQAATGIAIRPAPRQHRVILRNLTIRNFSVGIDALDSNVTLIDVRLANNAFFGIRARGTSEVTVDECDVIATGYRLGTLGNIPAPGAPPTGAAIIFQDSSSGAVFRTSVSQNHGAGIRDQSSGVVTVRDNYLFGNNPNTVGL